MSWAERSVGISPTIANSCSRTRSAGSTASTPISPDIDEQIEAYLAPFMWKTILGHQSHHRRRLGRSADTPSARAGGVLNQKQRSQPTPVAAAGAATDM
jgi:hypothetical protein